MICVRTAERRGAGCDVSAGQRGHLSDQRAPRIASTDIAAEQQDVGIAGQMRRPVLHFATGGGDVVGGNIAVAQGELACGAMRVYLDGIEGPRLFKGMRNCSQSVF